MFAKRLNLTPNNPSIVCIILIIGLISMVTGSIKEGWAKMPDDAVKIASEEVKRRYGWTQIEAEPPVRENGRWTVTVWHLPAKPGGFVDVVIDSDGKVVRCIGGK